MKKKLGGVFSILLAFVMTLAMITPVGLVTSFALDAPWADGTTVKYTNSNGDNDGYKEIKDSSGSPSYPAFCMNRHFNMSSSDTPDAAGIRPSERTFKNVTTTSESDAPLVNCIMENKDIPNTNSYPETYIYANQENALRAQLKRALYYGSVGKKADLGLTSDNDWYVATQIAVWQICHYGSGYQRSLYSSLQDVQMPLYGSDQVKNAAYKLLVNYVFAMEGSDAEGWHDKYPESSIPMNLYLAYGQRNHATGSRYQNLIFGELTEEPEPEPTVATKVNPKEINAAKGQTFTDTVTLNNLTVGTEYTITGKLMNKDTQSEVTSAICEPVTFTADAASMEKEMKFTVDASSLAGNSLVVFETLSWTVDGEQKSVGHTDYNDADQTLTVKEESGVSVKIKKTDMGGKELEGAELVVKSADGTEIESWTSTTEAHEITLAAGDYILKEVNAPEGYQKVTTEIEFSVDAEGKVTVKTTSVEPAGAVEVDSNGVLILKDELKKDGGDESGDKPYLQTEAKNTYISPAKNQSITDEVEYGGLKNGEDYVIVGVLKNKSTGETVSSECKPVKIENASESGVELMDFSKIDASGFQDGDQIVVFEYLYKGTTPGSPGDGTEVAKHADINDEAQTVTVVDGEISLLKTTDVEDAKVGDVIPYEITVSSTRDVTSVVNLEDYLGDNLEFVSASNGGELIGEDTQTVLWSALEVPANGSATVTIKAKIKNGSGKSVVNEAYVADDYNIDNPMGNDDDSAVLGVYESSNNNKDKNGTGTSKTKGAKTGDATKITLFIVVLILAAALTATMIIRRRRSNR